MSREMMVHVTPFEVHAAILEDGALAEYHVERRKDRSIVGNIYKGRVGKVLPGMQSAFVDIGIEKNAFLYVTDFFEEFADLKETLDVDVPKGRAAKPPARPPEEPAEAETAISAPPEREAVETEAAPAADVESAAVEGTAEAPKKRRRSRRSSRSRSRTRAAADATAADSEAAEATPATAGPLAETAVEAAAGTESLPAETAATPAEPSWTSPWAQPAADAPEQERDRTDAEDGTATIRFPDPDLTFCASRPRGGRRKRKGFNLAGEAEPGNIATMLKPGQEIIVQVMKEPMSLKSARITSHISLPGRQLVFLPTVNHVGVSRKIHSDQERKRLRTIIIQNRKGRPGGFIIRTASEGLSEAELVQDMEYLMKTWDDIQTRGAAESAPCLLYQELDLVEISPNAAPPVCRIIDYSKFLYQQK
ncbi:MAG TPA: ribonuclease E/G, partial [Acidobacteriota bacterium]|nr:ribonuclease E/G [Acidobacteriota bacterium]